ncbi:hypothetical protein CEP51_016672 [Fusarium floridanum]|uniref:Uncharacterized protein n=1 Tax=Fusarium floridanum TaxID=1325733 RepID=A0A428NIP8_9HYPO|nr:hypothetical protein CEP51_016672 [Fusarium floridanum]
MGAQVYGRETISFTIEAGTRVGAGLIEFSSRQISYTTGDTEVTVTATPEHGRTAFDLHTAFDSILSVFPSHPDFRSFANECLSWCYPYSITNWP